MEGATTAEAARRADTPGCPGLRPTFPHAWKGSTPVEAARKADTPGALGSGEGLWPQAGAAPAPPAPHPALSCPALTGGESSHPQTLARSLLS